MKTKADVIRKALYDYQKIVSRCDELFACGLMSDVMLKRQHFIFNFSLKHSKISNNDDDVRVMSLWIR